MPSARESTPGMRVGRLAKAVALLAAAAAGSGAALAMASVPDTSGVIHACVALAGQGTTTVPKPGSPNLTVIDPSAGQTCSTPGVPASSQTEIDWNVTGPAGPAGASGAQGPAGMIGPTGAAGESNVSTVVLAAPAVKSGDPPLGRVTLGTGSQALSFPFLGYSLGPDSGSTRSKNHNEIVITKPVSVASAKLLDAASSGKHFATVVIDAKRRVHRPSGGTTPKTYLKFKMKEVLISTVTDGGGAGGSGGGSARPLETLTLSFTKIEVVSTTQTGRDFRSG
jgi:type VI protein secretion system component Hcp